MKSPIFVCPLFFYLKLLALGSGVGKKIKAKSSTKVLDSVVGSEYINLNKKSMYVRHDRLDYPMNSSLLSSRRTRERAA